MAEVKLQVTKAVAEKLLLLQTTSLAARLDGQEIVLAREPLSNERDQRTGLRLAGVAGVLTALMALANFLWQSNRLVPITGSNSITQLSIYLGTLFSVLAFSWTLLQMRRSGRFKMRFYHTVTMSIAYGLVAFVGLSLFMRLWETAFYGMRLDIYTASLIIGALAAVMSYIMVLAATSLRFNTIVSVLTMTLGGGVILSMVSNGSAGWWQYNFSYLGTSVVPNGWIFNLSLIFSALILLALLDYLFTWLGARLSENRGLFYLRLLLTLTALTLGGVGAVPNNSGWMHSVHDALAQTLVLWILAMIIALRWLLPNAHPEFLITSYGLAGGLIAVDFLFQGMHYLSLTAFEMIAFGLAFGWMMLLLQYLRSMALPSSESVMVTVEQLD
ncbi:MAG TPA: DUF998 domain-containing protein [Lactobacillaceae bacterium]|jgi:hypothetical protein